MNVGKIKKIYKKENIYSLYLLALYGKADIASINFYKSQIEMLALYSRYMLACTYLAIGERKTNVYDIKEAIAGYIDLARILYRA